MVVVMMLVSSELVIDAKVANLCPLLPHVYNIDARRDMNLRSFLVYVGLRDYKRNCIRELQSVAIFLFVGIFLIHSIYLNASMASLCQSLPSVHNV